jgi:WD40 repeat protein
LATCGDRLDVWDWNRPEPVHSYKWGTDTLLSVKFNPAEKSLLASTCADRGVSLYDLRMSVPMRKFVLAMKSNKVCWNPMEPFNFVLANEVRLSPYTPHQAPRPSSYSSSSSSHHTHVRARGRRTTTCTRSTCASWRRP